MFKGLVFSCFHYSESPPIMRKDNYGELILKKLKWILENARMNKAIPICLGDVFHRKHGTSIREINKIIETIGDHEIYGILGNHDCQGYNINLETIPMGVLIKTGRYILIDNAISMDGVVITGDSYHNNYEIPETYNAIVNEEYRKINEVDFHIHLTHGMLTNSKLPYNATNVSDIEVNADVLFNGHNHKMWFDEERGIYNVGSIARVSMNENEINKTPFAFLIEVNGKNNYKITPVEIPIEKDVWSKEIKRDTMNEEDVEKFAKGIKEMELGSDNLMLEKILENETPDVKKKVYSYLGE